MRWIELSLPAIFFAFNCFVCFYIDQDFLLIFAPFGFATLSLYTPYFWLRRMSCAKGRLHLGLSWLTMLCWAALLTTTNARTIPAFFVAWLILVAATSVSGITGVFTYLRTRHPDPVASGGEFDLTTNVRSTIASIKDSFDEFHDRVSQERLGLDKMWLELENRIRAQQGEMSRIDRDLEAAKKDAEHYRRVASLTQEQQALFLELLRANKRQEFLLGLAAGLVATLFVEGTRLAMNFWGSLVP